jgi:hypothetical protein
MFRSKYLIFAIAMISMATATTANAQQVRSVSEDVINTSNGQYITAPGVPGCETNPFDWVQAVGNVIAGAEEGGLVGGGLEVLDAIGRSGRVGGAVGELLQIFYGPRYASCVPVSVVIPAGSRIVNVVYSARDGVAGEQPCTLDGNGWNVCGIGWSLFEPLQVTQAGNSIVVTSIFKNWSADRDRGATMTVYFIPPYGY